MAEYSVQRLHNALRAAADQSTVIGKGSLHLSDAGEEAIEDFVQEAVQDFTLATQAGEDVIRGVVRGYLIDAARPLGPIKIVERELFAPLLAEVRTWTCFVPLVNMQVSTRLRVGPA